MPCFSIAGFQTALTIKTINCETIAEIEKTANTIRNQLQQFKTKHGVVTDKEFNDVLLLILGPVTGDTDNTDLFQFNIGEKVLISELVRITNENLDKHGCQFFGSHMGPTIAVRSTFVGDLFSNSEQKPRRTNQGKSRTTRKLPIPVTQSSDRSDPSLIDTVCIDEVKKIMVNCFLRKAKYVGLSLSADGSMNHLKVPINEEDIQSFINGDKKKIKSTIQCFCSKKDDLAAVAGYFRPTRKFRAFFKNDKANINSDEFHTCWNLYNLERHQENHLKMKIRNNDGRTNNTSRFLWFKYMYIWRQATKQKSLQAHFSSTVCAWSVHCHVKMCSAGASLVQWLYQGYM